MSSELTSSSSANVRTSSNYKYWTEFFILYKNLPALWDKRCLEYKNRCVKMKGYDKMAAKLSELKPNSSRKDVLRRINIFRTNYRRERARTEECRARCQEFRPSLWYFNLLSFLDKNEFKSQIKMPVYREVNAAEDIIEETNNELEQYVIYENVDSNGKFLHSTYESAQNDSSEIIENHSCSVIDDEEENEIYEYFIENELGNIDQIQDLNLAMDCESATNDKSRLQLFEHDIYNEVISNLDSNENNLYHSKTKQDEATIEYMLTNDDANSNDVSKTVIRTIPIVVSEQSAATKKNVHTMTDEVPYHTSTDGEILARSWALQYDEMSTQQKIYARKAIGDILFSGCLGKLSIRQATLGIDTDKLS